MNPAVRIAIAVAAGVAMGGFIAGLSLAMNTPRVWPGVAIAFGVTVVQVLLITHRSSR